MEFLSEYDYAELKGYTLEQLYEYLKKAEDDCVQFGISMEGLQGQELEDANVCLNEYIAWVIEYKKEINLRLSIKTPLLKPACVGCEENQPNQIGHFGGCLPDPNAFNLDED